MICCSSTSLGFPYLLIDVIDLCHHTPPRSSVRSALPFRLVLLHFFNLKVTSSYDPPSAKLPSSCYLLAYSNVLSHTLSLLCRGHKFLICGFPIRLHSIFGRRYSSPGFFCFFLSSVPFFLSFLPFSSPLSSSNIFFGFFLYFCPFSFLPSLFTPTSFNIHFTFFFSFYPLSFFPLPFTQCALYIISRHSHIVLILSALPLFYFRHYTFPLYCLLLGSLDIPFLSLLFFSYTLFFFRPHFLRYYSYIIIFSDVIQYVTNLSS